MTNPKYNFWYMCNIWVILSRNVMYLYSKKSHLDQPFHCQSSRYDVIRWIFGAKNKGNLICNSPNDIISANFDSEKVDQDGIFYYKDILHFFFEWPKYYTYQKSYYSRTQLKCFILSKEEMGTAIMDNLQRDREVMTRTRERVGLLLFLNLNAFLSGSTITLATVRPRIIRT